MLSVQRAGFGQEPRPRCTRGGAGSRAWVRTRGASETWRVSHADRQRRLGGSPGDLRRPSMRAQADRVCQTANWTIANNFTHVVDGGTNDPFWPCLTPDHPRIVSSQIGEIAVGT